MNGGFSKMICNYLEFFEKPRNIGVEHLLRAT